MMILDETLFDTIEDIDTESLTLKEALDPTSDEYAEKRELCVEVMTDLDNMLARVSKKFRALQRLLGEMGVEARDFDEIFKAIADHRQGHEGDPSIADAMRRIKEYEAAAQSKRDETIKESFETVSTEDFAAEEVINPDDTPFVITDVDIDEPVEDADKTGPEPGVDTGLASALIAAINDEWTTIDKYNSIMSTMRYEKRDDMIPVIQDIVNEENKHVGQLQKLLETISANTELIGKGEQEAEKQMETSVVPNREDANKIDPNMQAYTTDDDDVDDAFFAQII